MFRLTTKKRIAVLVLVILLAEAHSELQQARTAVQALRQGVLARGGTVRR